MKCAIDDVRKALSGFGKLSFHPGWIPERFQDIADRRFSFVHIDVDLADPTRELAFLSTNGAGGLIVCDDYGMSTCAGATQSSDLFLADKPEKMLTLPDGGGFLIMNVSTAAAAPLDQATSVR
jgi:hypothetical protein